jgi:hypothetical protein
MDYLREILLFKENQTTKSRAKHKRETRIIYFENDYSNTHLVGKMCT